MPFFSKWFEARPDQWVRTACLVVAFAFVPYAWESCGTRIPPLDVGFRSFLFFLRPVSGRLRTWAGGWKPGHASVEDAPTLSPASTGAPGPPEPLREWGVLFASHFPTTSVFSTVEKSTSPVRSPVAFSLIHRPIRCCLFSPPVSGYRLPVGFFDTWPRHL